MINLALRNIFVHTRIDFFLHTVKLNDMGDPGITSSPKEGVLRIFIVLKKFIASAGFEAVNLGSNCTHINHYTTQAT
jgi:hypothetical protein